MENRTVRHAILLTLSICSFFLISFRAGGFIQRRYTLEEVINECSNIIFGTVTDVDQGRMTAKVRVEENLKGKSEFQEIKINISTGQGNFPQKMIQKFEVGLPMIIFYKSENRIRLFLKSIGIKRYKVGSIPAKKEEPRILSLGHVNGTWFQTFAQDQSDKSRVWWNFSHIEIHMHRTYNGTTTDFQEHLRSVLTGKNRPQAPRTPKTTDLSQALFGTTRVLMLTGNRYDVEFPALSGFNQVSGREVIYQKTKDRNLPNLGHADILWMGQGEICEGKYRLGTEQENRLKAFVKDGGIVIVSGQDSDDARPCATGWLSEPLNGVERWGRSDFQATRSAGELFSVPNKIRSGEVFIDDTWTGWNDKFAILATTNGGKEIIVAMLRYGKGMYLITSFQNETSANMSINGPMMENLIHFAVKWLTK